jgi:hypothetical protein
MLVANEFLHRGGQRQDPQGRVIPPVVLDDAGVLAHELVKSGRVQK